MSRLHDMKIGKIPVAKKKEFKQARNDKESILTRLKQFIFRNNIIENKKE